MARAARRKAQPAEDGAFLTRLLAHDVGNLATGLLLQVELARQEPAGPAMATRLDAVQHLGARIATVVRNFHALASGEGAPQSVDAKWLLDEALRAVRHLHPRADLVVHDAIGPGPLLVRGDPCLEHVFFNLAANAVLHNPKPNPKLWLRARRSRERVHVLVEDNGPGLPAAALRALAGECAEGSRGTGLAAAVALAARCGATLAAGPRVPGRPGEGTAFRLALPAAGAREPPGRAPQP